MYHLTKPRLLTLTVALITSIFIQTAPSSATGPQLLVDAKTGHVLAAEGADALWHPASLTKLMTAHLALKAIDSGKFTMSSPVLISEHAASNPASKLGLPAGQSLTLHKALSVMLTKSANDIAVAIAETIGGDENLGVIGKKFFKSRFLLFHGFVRFKAL